MQLQLHYITQHYATLITLHYSYNCNGNYNYHYIALHYTALINYIAPRYTTTTTTLH